MLRDAAPPPPLPMRPPCDQKSSDGSGWSSADTALLTLTLFTTWAARTGRVLRDVPISDLTADELVEFWTDDQLEEPYAAPARSLSRAYLMSAPVVPAKQVDPPIRSSLAFLRSAQLTEAPVTNAHHSDAHDTDRHRHRRLRRTVS